MTDDIDHMPTFFNILQMTYSDAFSWKKSIVFWFKFQGNLFQGV